MSSSNNNNNGSGSGSSSNMPPQGGAEPDVRSYAHHVLGDGPWNDGGSHDLNNPLMNNIKWSFSRPPTGLRSGEDIYMLPEIFFQKSGHWSRVRATQPVPPNGYSVAEYDTEVLDCFFMVVFSTYAIEGTEVGLNLMLMLEATSLAIRWEMAPDMMKKFEISIARYVCRRILHRNPWITDRRGDMDEAYFFWRGEELHRSWLFLYNHPEISRYLSSAAVCQLFYLVIPTHLWDMLCQTYNYWFCQSMRLVTSISQRPPLEMFREVFIAWYIKGCYLNQEWLDTEPQAQEQRAREELAGEIIFNFGVLAPSLERMREREEAGIAVGDHRPPRPPPGENPLLRPRHNSCIGSLQYKDGDPASGARAHSPRDFPDDWDPSDNESPAGPKKPDYKGKGKMVDTENRFECASFVCLTVSQPKTATNSSVPAEDRGNTLSAGPSAAPAGNAPESLNPPPPVTPTEPQLRSHFSESSDSSDESDDEADEADASVTSSDLNDPVVQAALRIAGDPLSDIVDEARMTRAIMDGDT